MHMALQARSRHQRTRFRFTEGQRFMHIGGEHLAILHEDFSVHDHGIHVASQRLMDQTVNRHPVGCQMRLAHIDNGDIGLFAFFERPDLVIHADCARRVDGDHFEDFARREDIAIVIVQDMLRRLGDACDLQHVKMAAGSRAVRSDGDRNASGHHLHDRCRTARRSVGDMRACLGKDVNLFI